MHKAYKALVIELLVNEFINQLMITTYHRFRGALIRLRYLLFRKRRKQWKFKYFYSSVGKNILKIIENPYENELFILPEGMIL